MLIQSHRHRPADLEIWREQEAADCEAANHARLYRLEREAVECIREFSQQPCYMSVSGGKDSSVMWSLAHLANCGIEAWHLDTKPLGDDHVWEVFGELQKRFPLPFHVVTNWCRRDESGWHATGTFEAGMKEIVSQAAAGRYICGVRADESGVRKISCRYHGKTTNVSCRPLAWWTAMDVYCYAAVRGVALHPNYAMNGGGRWPRERLRVAFLGLRHGEQFGRGEWEREYYGDVLNRLEMRSGTVRRELLE